jgi:acyl-CoA synthetase (AMP-forming)/AMP-acid ligase II
MSLDFDPLHGPATLPAQLAASAAEFGDAVFLAVEDGRRLTFAEANASARYAACAFIAAGINLGDRVAIWAPNSLEWVIACLGLQLAGGILVPLNTRFKGEEAAAVLERSRARILCTVGTFLGNDYLALLRGARGGATQTRAVAGLPSLEHVILLDDAPQAGAERWSDFLSQASIDNAALDARFALINANTPCDILFTSGTTGQPKGAVHGHRQALAAARVWAHTNGFVAGDRMLIVNPFFHSFGYRAGWVSCLVSGMTAYPVASLDTDAVLRLISHEKITVLPAPPTLLQMLLDHPTRDDYDLSSLRVGATGSANLAPDLFRRAREELGLGALVTSYGLTEASAMVVSCRLGDNDETMASTVGTPFPSVEIKIIDSEGNALPVGQPGELLVRGYNVMQGYFEDPAATAEAIDSDGWLHTGDVGVLDERHYLKIVDRLKDIVIVGGFNAYPAEIEHILRAAPGIADIAVIGIPDHRMGEVCAAFVIPDAGVPFDEAALTVWSRANLANFKVPRHFYTIDAFPRTPLGKVQKAPLREMALKLASG